MMGMGDSGVGAGLRSTFVIVLAVFGTIATITTVAAFFGDIWWGFDLAANYRWHLMWFLLIVSILYALSARGITIIVFLGAALVNGFLVAPLWMGSQPPATGEDGVLAVHADLGGGVTDMEATLRWLFNTEGDVIFLAGITQERALPLVADGSPYTMLAAPPSGSTGIVILGTEQWKVATTAAGDGQTIYRVSVPSGSQVLDIVTATGDMGTSGDNADALSARLDAIGASIQETTNSVAVIGNIGATPWAKGMRTLMSTANLRNAIEGSGYLATSPVSDFPVIGGWLGLPIDVVLMDSTLTPLELKAGPDLGAKHLPITVVIGPGFEN
ncbi:MAG: hypothetical protein GWP18_06225 [Proteobacteria bacterium]|nr:hypothetical protein [Pseudomonadota bacterium]